ncbi:MAG: hypothetical protein YYHSYBAR_001362 [Candidatus Fervidibacter sacchari]
MRGEIKLTARDAMIRLLRYAVEQQASDLHLIVGVPPIIRVHGELFTVPSDKLNAEQVRALCSSLLNEKQLSEFERNGYLCVGLTHPELGYFRITLYRHRGNMEAAIRIGRQYLMSLEETGLPEIVKELTRKSTGLVLIVGPTGSGKTTTMYAMIDFINRERRCKIVTVEDPVEYFHENRLSVIVQQEVGTDVPSFSQALIQILRQDPDVICIGEMRDLETIATALLAAETGHLVIATLHTGRAAETINRIIDVFPPYQQQQVRVQLAAVLEGIICQRLLPRIDKPGRVLAYEILLATPAIRSMIREGKPEAMINNVIEMSRSEGMVLLENCLKELYEQGIISYDVALAHAENPARIRD